VTPESSAQLKRDAQVEIQGIAIDDGTGIRRVEASTDGGRTWTDASLDSVIDRYSWRRWRLNWSPTVVGHYSLQCRATNGAGETQTSYEWNHGGYCRNVIQTIDVEVGA
jgi:hypothetical protein